MSIPALTSGLVTKPEPKVLLPSWKDRELGKHFLLKQLVNLIWSTLVMTDFVLSGLILKVNLNPKP